MSETKKIKVLIVDDSIVFREVLSKGISSDSEIEVVAKASNPFEARDKIMQFSPDVMTCDIEMPKMNGIEFIQRLLPQYPIPVIMISTVNNAVFDAMNAGAVDFVAKPSGSIVSTNDFIKDLIIKIKAASKAKVKKEKEHRYTKLITNDNLTAFDFIAIGASTGGTEAIFSVINALPSNMPGIVIVQHIPPVFSNMFAERLNTQTKLKTKEAKSNDYIEKGTVLIAPGDKHMIVKKVGSKYKVECFSGDKVNGHCPSVDVLFDSVAKEAGEHALGVILTGMGRDGANGLLAMRKSGAYTIGQDEQSSVVYGMPKVAFDIGAVCKQVALSDIPTALLHTLKEKPATTAT